MRTDQQGLAAAEAFHAHVDYCPQCKPNAFDLCPIGHELLAAVGLCTLPESGNLPKPS
jgi:hypothetical protein